MSVALPVTQSRVFFTRQYTRVVNESVKACSMQGLGVYSVAKGPTDAIGTTTVTLTNLVPGSRYRIERAGDGSLALPSANAEGVAAGSEVALTLDYYATGSPNNTLRVKVRKATSEPRYKPFETQVTLGPAAQSSFIAQQPD
jgi:hypothetical protein